MTTYADTNESGAPFQALRELGVRGISYQEVFGPDPAQCAESLAGLRAKVDQLRPQETSLVRLGVSPQRVYVLVNGPGFPEPLGKLGRSAVWRWSSVERWARQTGRLPASGPTES